MTSTTVPRGGIHKDVINSENVALHKTAVLLATTASLQLLEDIRLAVGDKDFLRCEAFLTSYKSLKEP